MIEYAYQGRQGPSALFSYALFTFMTHVVLPTNADVSFTRLGGYVTHVGFIGVVILLLWK